MAAAAAAAAAGGATSQRACGNRFFPPDSPAAAAAAAAPLALAKRVAAADDGWATSEALALGAQLPVGAERCSTGLVEASCVNDAMMDGWSQTRPPAGRVGGRKERLGLAAWRVAVSLRLA